MCPHTTHPHYTFVLPPTLHLPSTSSPTPALTPSVSQQPLQPPVIYLNAFDAALITFIDPSLTHVSHAALGNPTLSPNDNSSKIGITKPITQLNFIPISFLSTSQISYASRLTIQISKKLCLMNVMILLKIIRLLYPDTLMLILFVLCGFSNTNIMLIAPLAGIHLNLWQTTKVNNQTLLRRYL